MMAATDPCQISAVQSFLNTRKMMDRLIIVKVKMLLVEK